MSRLVVGVGLSSSAVPGDLAGLLDDTLRELGASRADVARVATIDRHARHDAVLGLGLPVVGVDVERLAAQVVPTPSPRVQAAVGTPSVAEAAAVWGGGELLVRKRARGGATLAVARSVDLTDHGDAQARGATVDLAVNVAVGSPPPFVRDAVLRALDDIAGYPDARPATEAAARHLGVDPASVLLTNGSAEAFHLVAVARPWQHPVVVHPQFTEPEAALRAAGHRVHRHVLDSPYRLDPEALRSAHPDADLVAVGNPTNPTSVLHRRDAVLALAPPGGVLVVDEAFVDTCTDPRQSLLADAARPGSGVLVLRSLTKTFGLAGLRAGYVVGDPALVAELAAQQPRWSVSGPALAAVRACLGPEGDAFVAQQRERLLANAAHLAAGLRTCGLDVPAPPQAPFVLATGAGVGAVRERLLEEGIALRTGATFPGLGDDHVRVAARDPHVVAPVLARLAALTGTPAPTPPHQGGAR